MTSGYHDRNEPARSYWAWIAAALALSGVVHAACLHGHPGPSGDSAEFQYLGQVLGISHPTGYPLYVLLSRVWTAVIPFGTLAFRVNLLSLACGILSCVFLAGIGRRMHLRGKAVAAALGLLSATPTWWRLCTVAEVYALHALFMSATLFYFISWYHSDRDRDFRLGVLIYGLSFAHHLTSLLLLPALLVLVHRTGWRKALRLPNLVWSLLCVVLGASLYAYLWIRSADPSLPVAYVRIQDWSGFWAYVTGEQFHGRLVSEASVVGHGLAFVRLFQGVLEPWHALVPLVLLGIPYAVYTDRQVVGPLLLYAVLHFAFMFFYQIPDILDYRLPLLAVGAILLAATFHHLLDWFESSLPARPAKIVLGLLLLLSAAFQVNSAHATFVELRTPRGAAEAEEIRDALLSHPRALLVTPHWQQTNLARYYLHGEKLAALGAETVELVPADASARHGAGLREHLREWGANDRVVLLFTDPNPLYDLGTGLHLAGIETAEQSPRIRRVLRVPDEPTP